MPDTFRTRLYAALLRTDAPVLMGALWYAALLAVLGGAFMTGVVVAVVTA